MIGRLICFFKGHRRGKLVSRVTERGVGYRAHFPLPALPPDYSLQGEAK